MDAMLFLQNTHNNGNNAIKMSQAFHDIARFECFTDLNLFKYAVTVFQNWNMDALQIIIFDGSLFFVNSYGRRR